MKVNISTHLPCDPNLVIDQVKSPRLLFYVAYPFVKFKPIDPSHLPENWIVGTYWMKLYLFGFIPFGKQAVVITYPKSPNCFQIRDNGYSFLINKWDHMISVVSLKNGTLYNDTLIINAGLITPFIWVFAQAFYWHRQRRWRQLVKNKFSFPK